MRWYGTRLGGHPITVPRPAHIYDPSEGLTLEDSFLMSAGISAYVEATLTPEPATLGLLAAGPLPIAALVRRRRLCSSHRVG